MLHTVFLVSSEFLKLYNRGGLTLPSEKWANEVKEMYSLFNDHHPEKGLSRAPGLISKFFEKLKKNFPTHQPKVLHLIARCFTRKIHLIT